MQMGIVVHPEFILHLSYFTGSQVVSLNFCPHWDVKRVTWPHWRDKPMLQALKNMNIDATLLNHHIFCIKYMTGLWVHGKYIKCTSSLHSKAVEPKYNFSWHYYKAFCFQYGNNNFLHFEDMFTFWNGAILLNRRIKSDYLWLYKQDL